MLWLGTHPSDGSGFYGHQLGFSDDGKIWHRKVSNGSYESTWYNILSSRSSSVSKSGETLTVVINGTQKSLTNTWRGITDSYSGTSSDISLSQKGANDLYSLFGNYLPLSGGVVKGNLTIGDANATNTSQFLQIARKYNDTTYYSQYGMLDGGILSIGQVKGSTNLGSIRIGENIFSYNSNPILHSGNYTTYCATANHNHNDIYAPISHSHDYISEVLAWNNPNENNPIDLDTQTNSWGTKIKYSGWGFANYSYVSNYYTTSAHAGSVWTLPEIYGGLQIACPYSSIDLWTRKNYNGTWSGWVHLITSSNIGSQSVGYANSAGSVAWGNVTGKPSTFTPSDHTHSYLPLSGGNMTGGISISSPNWTTINYARTDCGTGSVGGLDGQGLYFQHTTEDGTQTYMYLKGGVGLKIGGNTVWHAGNDGSGSGLDADTLDGQELVTQVSNWNTKSYAIFKSSENSSTNGPTTGYIYGTTFRFHRDNYWTNLVVDLYNDKMFFRRFADNVYGSWRELIHSGNYTSYCASSSHNHDGTYLKLSGGTLHNTTFYPLTINGGTEGAGMQFTHDGDNPKLGIVLFKPNDWGMAMLHFTANKAIGITDAGVPYFGWGSTKHTLIHSNNYTSYINSTNFPGLAGVRSVTISGDQVRVNTNGSNTDLTIPYATNSGNSSKVGGKSYSDIILSNGRNLIRNYDTEITETGYMVWGTHVMTETVTAGSQVTITVEYSLPNANATKTWLQVYTGGGYANIAGFDATPGLDHHIQSVTTTMSYAANWNDNGVCMFYGPSDKVGTCTVHRFKIERGDHFTGWTAAPEDIPNKNLINSEIDAIIQ